jgi:hypothetical protein
MNPPSPKSKTTTRKIPEKLLCRNPGETDLSQDCLCHYRS